MNNRKTNVLPQFGLSSEESNTSTSSLISSESAEPFIHLKETKTHLFCLIPSDNENHQNTSRAPQLIRIKISKRRPQSKHLTKNKDYSNLSGGVSNVELMVRRNRTRINNDLKMSSLNLLSNRKKTDHPSFVVLPDNKKHADVNVKITGNQSTSDNSNETYVIRSKNENKLLANRASQTSFRRNLVCPISKNNSRKAVESSSNGLRSTEIKSEDYCECAKNDKRRQIDSSYRTWKNDSVYLPIEPSSIQAIKHNQEELFRIKFIDPTPLNASSRLKAGQDRGDENYKIPRYTCPKITRIFPPSGSSTRRDHSESNYSGSTSTNHKNNDIVKINYSLVRRCLKHSSADEKCEVLDALRMRIKSKTLNVAATTIEDIQKFDLFGVQCKCRSRPILEDLFWPMAERIPHPLQTSIARLINAMVSFETGRDYFNNRSIIHLLTWGDLGRDNIDEEMADNLIAVMMKLSKSRFHCTDMIKKGLLKWLLNHMELAEYSSSKYHLECMTGLLRMLMSIENSIDFSMTEIRDWIVILGRYLDSENTNVRKNILASLLALFQRNGAITAANEINFELIINKHIEMSSNSNEKKHLKLLNQLITGKSNLTKTRKSAIRSAEEELDFDEETESVDGAEIDYYPGEKLLREKFCFNKDDKSASRSTKKNFSFEKTTKPTCNQPNDDNLASRVFIEHLHCLLPKIDHNRIFPMFNYRPVDTPQSCVHINETPPPRPPYESGTKRTFKFHDRLLRKGKKVTNPNEQCRQGNTVVKQLPTKMNEEVTGEQRTNQQIPAKASNILQDLKNHQQLSSGAMLKKEFTVRPVESQELYVGETNLMNDEIVSRHKSDQQLSEIVVEPINHQEQSTQETNMLKNGASKIVQQLVLEYEEPKNESTESVKVQELSPIEPKTINHLVPKSNRQSSVRASEIFQDEIIVEPTKDQQSTNGERDESIGEVALGSKSDQQLSAEMYLKTKEISSTVELDIVEDGVTESDQQFSAETTDKLKNESTLEHVNQSAGEPEALKDHVVGGAEGAKKSNALENRELSIVEPDSLEDEVFGSDQKLSLGANETLMDEKLFTDEPGTFEVKNPKNDQQLSHGAIDTLTDKIAVASIAENYEKFSVGEPKMLKDEVAAGWKSNQDSSAETVVGLERELDQCESVPIAAVFSDKYENLKIETLTSSKSYQRSKSLESLKDVAVARAFSDTQILTGPEDILNEQAIVRQIIDEGVVAINKSKEKKISTKSDRQVSPSTTERLEGSAIVSQASENLAQVDAIRKPNEELGLSVKSDKQIYDKYVEQTSTREDVISSLIPDQQPRETIIDTNISDQEVAETRLSKELQAGHVKSDEILTVKSIEFEDGATYTPKIEAVKPTEGSNDIKSDEQLIDTIPWIKTQQLEVYSTELNDEVTAPLEIDRNLMEETATSESDKQVNTLTEVCQSQHLSIDKIEIEGSDRTLQYIRRLAHNSVEVGQVYKMNKGESDQHLAGNARSSHGAILSVESAQQLTLGSVEKINEETIDKSASEHHIGTLKCHRRLAPRSVEVGQINKINKEESDQQLAGNVRAGHEAILSVESAQQLTPISVEKINEEAIDKSASDHYVGTLKCHRRLEPRSVEVGQINKIKEESDQQLAGNARAGHEAILSVESAQQLTPRSVEKINEKTIDKSASDHRIGTLECLGEGTRRLAPRSLEVGQVNITKKGVSDHHIAAKARASPEAILSVESVQHLTTRSVEKINEETIDKSASDHPIGTLKCHRRLVPRSVEVHQVNQIEKWASDQNLGAEDKSKQQVVAGVKSAQQLRETSVEKSRKEKINKLPSYHHEIADVTSCVEEMLEESDLNVDYEKLPFDKSIRNDATETFIGSKVDQRQLNDFEENSTPNDQQVGASKDETVASTKHYQQSSAELTGKLEGEAVTRRDSSSADLTKSQHLEVYAIGLKEEVLPRTKIDEQLKEEIIFSSETGENADAMRKSEEQLVISLERNETFSNISVNQLNDKVIVEQKSDRTVSVDTKEFKDHEIAGTNSSTEKILEQSNMNVDMEELPFNKTSIGSTIDQELQDERIARPSDQQLGALSKSKVEKIASMENFRQFSPKSVDKLGRCSVTRRASDHCSSGTMSKLIDTSATSVKSDQQLSAEYEEMLKGEVNDNWGSGYPTSTTVRKSTESASMKSIQLLPKTSVEEAIDRDKTEELGGAKSAEQLMGRYVEMAKDETINERASDHSSTETNVATLTIDPSFKKDSIAERVSFIRKSEEIESSSSDEQFPATSVEMLTFGAIARRAQAMLKSKSDQQIYRKNVVKPTRSEPPIALMPTICESVKIDENLKEEAIGRQTKNEQVRMEQHNSKGDYLLSMDVMKDEAPENEFFKQTTIEQSQGEMKEPTEKKVRSRDIDQNLKIDPIALRTSDSSTIVKPKGVKSDQQLTGAVGTLDLSVARVKSDQPNDITPTITQQIEKSKEVSVTITEVISSVEEMIEENILNIEMPSTEQLTANRSHSDITGAESSEKIFTERSRTETVDSRIWREMRNSDELIDILCEKVLKKLREKGKFCGSNCGSRCGGLNPKFEANKAESTAESQNLE